MPQLRNLMQKYLADGKIDRQEIEALGESLAADRTIDRPVAEFLVELRKRTDRMTPGFDKFFHQAIKSHLLTDGAITAAPSGSSSPISTHGRA